MKPDKAGIWEWFDEKNVRRLVSVCDVSAALYEMFPDTKPHLRVYFWGGYYNVNDEVDDVLDMQGRVVQKNRVEPAEWPDRWGNYVGPQFSVPEDQLYQMPTKEDLICIDRIIAADMAAAALDIK